MRARARLHSHLARWPLVVALAGCSPSLDDATPETSTAGDEALTCDLGMPGAFVDACTLSASPRPVFAAPLASTTPPVIAGAVGVHLVEGATNAGVVAFVPDATSSYDVYLGTPNIPFRVVGPDGTVVTSSCTSSITAAECSSLRKVLTFDLTGNHTYRLEFGPTSLVRYVRVYVQRRVPVATCSAAQLAEEANACVGDPGDEVPLDGSGIHGVPAVALDTVYGLRLASDGSGSFEFVPASDGDYELYLGTPNLPLSFNSAESSFDCTRYLPAGECSLFRRGDRLTLRGSRIYVFHFDPNPAARYVRVTIRQSPASLIKLAPAQMFAAAETPYFLTAADLDGDHILDLVVSSPDDAAGRNIVDLLRGSGTGSFTDTRQIATSAPNETVTSDFDHDGIPDIVGIARDGQGPLPDFYLHGEGNFTYAKTTWGDQRDFLSHLDAGDFDEDGTIDLVAAYTDDPNATGGFVIVAAPAFTVMQDVTAFGHDTIQAVAGDFNGDGHQDVVAGSAVASVIRLYTGDGSGTVSLAFDVALPGAPIRQLAVFDLDHDGRSDVVAIHGDDTVTVSYGQATGFSAPAIITTGLFFTQGIAAGDFDHDGRTDLAFGTFGSDATVEIFVATDTGFVHAASLALPGGHLGSDFAVGDFNGDGFDDLATTGLGAVAVYLSTP